MKSACLKTNNRTIRKSDLWQLFFQKVCVSNEKILYWPSSSCSYSSGSSCLLLLLSQSPCFLPFHPPLPCSKEQKPSACMALRKPPLQWPGGSTFFIGPVETTSSLGLWKQPLHWPYGSPVFLSPEEALSSWPWGGPFFLGPVKDPVPSPWGSPVFLGPDEAPSSLALLNQPLPPP